MQSIFSVIRLLFHVATVVFIGLWGFTAFEFPLPALLWGVGGVVVAILVWALFLSPKPVLHTDRFGQSLVELLFLAGGAAAMYLFGVPLWVVVIYGVVAPAIAYVDILVNRNPVGSAR